MWCVASFLLFAFVGVECCVGVAVWFRTCALAPAPACGLAAHTDVGPGFDSTSPAKSIRSASHRTGNLAGMTEKSGAVGAFGKAGRVDTICIPLRDVGPTAEKLYLSDQFGRVNIFIIFFFQVGHSVLAISSICRAARVLKLVKHHRGLQLMYKAIKLSLKEILLLLLLMAIGTLVFASLIYYAEFTDPRDTFSTIPIGFWWSIVTMTTVGYGDKYPVTTAGYIVGEYI